MKHLNYWLILILGLGTLHLHAQTPTTLTILTHDSFNASAEVLAQFEALNNVQIEIIRVGDAGQLVNQAILSRSNPIGDVLYGVDNTFLSRALNADLFLPYESSLLEFIDPAFVLDAEHRVTPVDFGDVCLNYDKGYFQDESLPIPDTLRDLTLPIYRGLLVGMNPATSSPGLAFLLATIAEFGTEGDYTYLDYWTELIANDMLITQSWSDAYFGHFTAASADGSYPMVVSYASSPPFTVGENGEASTASIVADGMCFRQIEFVGILRGTHQQTLAQAFVDFMLNTPFQEDMPFQMYVFPVNSDAIIPDLFAQHAAIPANPVVVDAALIETNREIWLEAWLETAMRP